MEMEQLEIPLSYFRSSVALTSSANHCPKSRSKLMSPSCLNIDGSKSSNVDATDCMKSVERKFGCIGSVGTTGFMGVEGLPNIDEGDGAVMFKAGPGAGVVGALPPWGALPELEPPCP